MYGLGDQVALEKGRWGEEKARKGRRVLIDNSPLKSKRIGQAEL